MVNSDNLTFLWTGVDPFWSIYMVVCLQDKDTGIFTSNVLLIDFEVNFKKLKLL